MPTYEYKCPACGHEFEVVQKISVKPGAKCPACGKKAQRQISAGGGLVFKGSGFYITDYKRAGEKKPAADAATGGGASGGGAASPGTSGGTASGGSASGSAGDSARPAKKKDD